MTQIWNTDDTKCWQDVEQQELSFIAGGTATLEDSLAVSYKTKMFLPYDLAIILLGFYPELKIYIHTSIFFPLSFWWW